MIFAVIMSALNSGCGSSPPAGGISSESGEIKIDFSLEPETVLEYKGTNTREMNYYGNSINIVHRDRIRMTVREKTDENIHRIRIRYLESGDKMIRGDEMADFDNPVKPEGRVVEVEVTPRGEINDVKGVIPGLSGEEIKEYLEIWFFKLPDEARKVGESWRRDLSDSTETGVREGWADITFKSLESEKGIAVAKVDVAVKVDVERRSERGKITGLQETRGEISVAVDGGYIVLYESESEFRGKLTGTGGDESDISNFSNLKVELIK